MAIESKTNPGGTGTGARLTVVTVVKNALRHLQLTHGSLEAQTERDFRWLVVDGVSTDGTLDWLQGLGPSAVRFVSGKDKSIYDAMNKAAGLVQTEYFLYLNAGDTFCDSSVVSRICEGLNRAPADMAYGKAVIMAGGGFPSRTRGMAIRGRWDIFYGKIPCHQSTVISKRIFAEIGPYDDSFRVYADREWLMRLFASGRNYKLSFLDFPVVNYDPSGYSYQKFFASKKEYFRMIASHGNPFEIAWGTAGWLKAALHNVLSKSHERRLKAGRPVKEAE
ncbi:MAG: glycosyl transferase family 2 [Fibrobacteres bacterium]|nr:glycosyl transferase family 2 [Fibrobacterota bacterium]